ncbi:MAG: hypothetical protein DMG21_14335 [Acidobacteria bacterium]|nr:MAG: hypothetical protein DMG21_14335 [Acidobacteriota bacterium]
MPSFTKQAIIEAYNELVKSHCGKLIGERVFKTESGISPFYWKGGYWRSFSAFQTELGYKPNAPTAKVPDGTLLQRFAEVALELNRVPTEPDLVLKRKEDATFPGKSVFRRWGTREKLLAKVAEFCKEKGQFEPVLKLLDGAQTSAAVDRKRESMGVKGFVYLLSSGKYHKIGRTNAEGRRLRELAIQLPHKPIYVHVIETDDPEGIERYWHARFADKRQDGEWFSLSADDINAFKRRRFQ